MKKPLLPVLIALLSACTTLPLSAPESVVQPPTHPELSTFKRDFISGLLGDSPNFAQTANGNISTVVSRNFGRGAKAGALVEFFYPSYARDHLWDAYNGIYYQNRMYWFHELELMRQTIIEDTGLIVTEFRTKDGKLKLKTTDVALRNNDTHVRHLDVTNTSGEPVTDVKLFFYEFLNVNYLGAGDSLTYDPQQGILHHQGKDVHFTIAADRAPEQWQVGGAGNVITKAHDARLDAGDGKLNGNLSAKGFVGLGVNGNLGHRITRLQPGETFSLNYYLSVGRSPQESQGHWQQAKALSWATIEQQEKAYWQQFLNRARQPVGADPQLQRVYRRSLITLKQNTANNGAVMAAPTLTSPAYALSWPRDGSVTAAAYLEAGMPEEARQFIDFMSQMQKSNGGWAVNFFLDGSNHLWDFGDRKNEHDQVGTMVWVIYEYYRQTRDLAWLRGKWPVVQKANDFLLRFQTASGLIGPCRDLWELHTDKSWTFSNAATYAGFSTGAEIAQLMGDSALNTRWKMAAERVKTGIQQKLWSESGQYFVRGADPDSGQMDNKVEAANLGLAYPFDVLNVNEPRMKAMAEKIYSTLTSGRKGVRRYTDDRYYDGHPWPATTDWLAIYYLKQGNRSRAIELHNAVTGYAMETDALMLGEQFDEKRRQWVSAFPLTWSHAKYILATLEIYGAGHP